jgi:protein O-GlcNAc transferase
MESFLDAYKDAQDLFEKKMYTEALVRYKECVDTHFYNIQRSRIVEIKESLADSYYKVAYIIAGHIKLYDTRQPFTQDETYTIYRGTNYLEEALGYYPFNDSFKELYRVMNMYLAKFELNPERALKFLLKILIVYPYNALVQYNIGQKYQITNDFSSAICHYKLCLEISKSALTGTESRELRIKCLNGLGAIYFNVQRRDLARYYFELAYELNPNDPDVNNQLGVIYTDLRLSREAIHHYKKCISNADNAHISQDKSLLLASTYMNMGLMYTYTGDVIKGIDCYNTSLRYKPGFSLAFQNKLLDINYIADKVDAMYISKLHKGINKCFPRVNKECSGYIRKASGEKLRIGFLSGDFICHPVSYFTSCIFDNLDTSKFEMYCYSTKVIKTDDRFPKPIWKVVRNMPCKNLVDLIKGDLIDILIDLSGNTGDNRMDVLAEKPAPIIINAIGYPNTTGLDSIDYKLTDKYADSIDSEKYYSEKLLYMDKSFLCYTPTFGKKDNTRMVPLMEQKDLLPKLKDTDKQYTFGCFNRYNKISDTVIKLWCEILKECVDARFVIKTKEFSSPDIIEHFWGRIPDEYKSRIEVLPYRDSYEEHLLDYNKIDVALDTIPYSGTTTTCESLLMGVPVIVIKDTETHLHVTNVGSSIMTNSGLSEFVTGGNEEYIGLAVSRPRLDKEYVRDKFLSGYTCNVGEYINNLEEYILNGTLCKIL